LIDDISGQYGVDPNVIRHMAVCETGFNAAARNHQYGGLFQFDSQTWKTYRQRLNLDSNPDLRFDAKEAIITAAYIIQLGKSHLWPNCHA
jgi:soluble lytic murein transglycosylase-like protein